MMEVSPSVIAEYRDRIELLEAENADLRAQLRRQPADEFVGLVAAALKIRSGTGRMLWALWDCRRKSRETIYEALYGDQLDQPEIHIVSVHAHYLRRAVEPVGATITTINNFGYWLTPADRAIIAAHIGIEVGP